MASALSGALAGVKTAVSRIFWSSLIFVLAAPVSMAFAQGGPTNAESSLEAITVQAPRPDWERILSPGAVTVVEPDRFKGAQKNLAEFLDQVPGLFVHRVTGAGQYTTVRMRGSTSAQVNVYVDGVLQNFGNDAAVDISLIPVSQVARIEVYRGYVPVRFSGAPIGGVINVVTKKAETLGATIEAGVASLNGQRYTLTATTPTFWGGSLLLGAHYDQSEGNYKFHNTGLYRGHYHIATLNRSRTEFRRKNNEYSNADFLTKWQNNNFSFKVAHKTTDRSLPDPSNIDYIMINANYNYFKRQSVKQTDFVAGYRNTIADFDFGIQLYHVSQDKRVNAHHHPCVDEPVGSQNCGNYPIWPGSIFEYRDTVKKGGQVDISYTIWDNLIEAYADYSEEHLHVIANDWVLPYNSTPLIDMTKRYFPDYYETRYHFQVQDTVKFGKNDSTKLTAVYKYDKVKSTGNNTGD